MFMPSPVATGEGMNTSHLTPPPPLKHIELMTTPPLPVAPRLVLFDLDDTLCDYASARARRLEIAFRIAFEEAGIELDADIAELVAESIVLHPHSTEHFGELLRKRGVESERAVLAARQWFGSNRFHTLALYEDSLLTLETVRSHAAIERIGLVTNGPTEVQRRKIELLGIERYLDFIVVSEEFGHWKPEPEIFAEALRLGRAAADETIFIGDSSENDIAGAQAAGIAGIWINPTGQEWDQSCPAPTRSVTCLAEVRQLLAAGF